MLRGRRALIVAGILVAMLATAFFGVRWALRPDNLARVISNWTERELGAQLQFGQAPGVRLVPRLQLSLSDLTLERNGELIASVGELNVALPWSALWRDGLNVESLALRQPTIALPALNSLLRDLSAPEEPSQAPTLPRIAVGIRIEDGSLLSGPGDDAWRLDRISMVTTPLREGATFHLDAGARLRGTQNRTVSLTLNATPESVDRSLRLEGIDAKLVVSPDNQQLDAALAMQLRGRAHIDRDGLALIELDGETPGWPDWLPNLLDFSADQPAQLAVRWLDAGQPLLITLGQNERTLEARIDADDLKAALALMDRPLLALSAVRSQWRLDSLVVAGVRLEGIRVDVVAEDDEQPANEPEAGQPAGQPADQRATDAARSR